MFCSECGTEVGKESQFCSKCGKNVKAIETKQAEEKKGFLSRFTSANKNPTTDLIVVMLACIAAMLMPNASVSSTLGGAAQSAAAYMDPIFIPIAIFTFGGMYLAYIKKYKPLIFVACLLSLMSLIEALAILNIANNPPDFVAYEVKYFNLFIPVFGYLIVAYKSFKFNSTSK